MTPSDTGPRGTERTLVERLRLAEVHWLETAQDEADRYGEGTDDQDGMEDMADMLGQAASEITSLRQQVEALTKERDEAGKAAKYLAERASAAERRLAEVRAEEREACAKIGESWSRHQELLLRCGEMTAQELRTAVAVTNGIASAIRNQGASNG